MMFSEFSTVFLYRILLSVIIFATDALVARKLGPSGKGYYYILLVSPQMLATLAAAGLDYSLNFFGHKEKERISVIFTTSLFLSFVIAFILCGMLSLDVAGSLSWFYRGIPKQQLFSVYLSIGVVFSELAFALTAMYAMTIGRVHRYSQMRIFRRTSVFVGTVATFYLLTFSRDQISQLMVVQLAAISCSILWCLHKCGYKMSRPNFSARMLFKEGLQAYPARVSESLVGIIGSLLLGIWGNGTQVGLFSIAIGISSLIRYVSDSLQTVLFSMDGRKNAGIHFQSVRFMFAFATLLVLGVGTISTFFIPIIFGSAFKGSVMLLWFILPGAVFYSVIDTISPYIVHRGLSRLISIGYLLGLGANVILNIFSIPAFGAAGVSVVYSISFALSCMVMVVGVARVEKVRVVDLVLLKVSDFEKMKNVFYRRFGYIQ